MKELMIGLLVGFWIFGFVLMFHLTGIFDKK